MGVCVDDEEEWVRRKFYSILGKKGYSWKGMLPKKEVHIFHEEVIMSGWRNLQKKRVGIFDEGGVENERG